jgi:hypothetical protein
MRWTGGADESAPHLHEWERGRGDKKNYLECVGETLAETRSMSSPEDKEKTKPGTSIVVMPTVSTDNVIHMC